jgi:DNA-binding response OmpR family regulator
VNGGRKRVLVIDDDEDVRDLIKSLLESEGFEVAVAADGREGLELQKRNPAAVVVTDLFMPGKEGIETIVDLRREFPQTNVVVVSGGTSLTGRDYGPVARELGAVATLRKPFEPRKLIDIVRKLSDPPDRRSADRRSSGRRLADRRVWNHRHSEHDFSGHRLADRRLSDRRLVERRLAVA